MRQQFSIQQTHFVFPETHLIETVEKAIQATTIFQDRIILLGVRPTGLELDYGWIEPGGSLGWREGLGVRQVHAFLEKPDASRALAAWVNGALWNTFIMAAKVETLWRLGWECMPEVMDRFEQLEKVIGTSQEGSILREIYQDMPQQNFSSDLLSCVPESIGVIELKDVLRSDWGQPERIAETLEAIGKAPTFSLERVKEQRRALGKKHFLEVS